MSRILQASPFEEKIVSLNEAQLDFILECYSKDHPEELKFSRPNDQSDTPSRIAELKAWRDTLTDEAWEQMMYGGKKPVIPDRYKKRKENSK